ncbi:MAG: hypothetical protein EOM52_05610 [Clostridia bacterium]|nr:hypothetical protein [Clostridia bacterium]
MRNEPEKLEESHLQHEAEHVKPAKKLSVMSYLAILFGAAFLLMLLSYFMQQRNSSEALDNQQTLNVNAMKSIEELRSDNEELLKKVDELQSELEIKTSEVKQFEEASAGKQTELNKLQAQHSALNYLNQIRTLYNQRKITNAKAVLGEAEKAMAFNGGMEEVLGWVSSGLTAEARDVYDPLDAYRSLLDWLS